MSRAKSKPRKIKIDLLYTNKSSYRKMQIFLWEKHVGRYSTSPVYYTIFFNMFSNSRQQRDAKERRCAAAFLRGARGKVAAFEKSESTYPLLIPRILICLGMFQ